PLNRAAAAPELLTCPPWLLPSPSDSPGGELGGVGGGHASTAITDGAGSALLHSRPAKLGAVGRGRPGRRDQPHHAGQAGVGGAPRPLGPVDLAEPALPEGTGSEQRAPRPALHADAPAGDGRGARCSDPVPSGRAGSARS